MTVFVDADVVMYLIGGPHPHRDRAELAPDELVLSETRLVTDAEVFPEILHRCAAALSGLVDDVFSIGVADLDAAKALVLDGAGARDALHVATMRAHGVTRILTFDRGFDRGFSTSDAGGSVPA